jgi:oligosaccharide repeat unit polymerase
MSREQMVAKPNKAQAVWWLNPAVAFGMPAAAAGSAAYITESNDYLYFWRTPKYFDLSCLGLLLAAVVIFGCGCLFGAARRSNSGVRQPSTDWTVAVPWRLVRLMFTISFVLTVVAYAIWFAVGIKNGLNLGLIMDIIHRASDANYDLRKEYFKTIPGVTTATQFGLTVIVLGIPLGVARGWRTVRWQLLSVFVLGLVRALLNSERLAVIELLVPLVVSFIWLRPARGRLLRFLTRLAPILAAAFLYLFFAAGEYFRSWSSFYANRESSFWGFIALRLMGYYTTALNNGALLLASKQTISLHMPLATLSSFWRFPILKDVLPSLFPAFDFAPSVPDVNYVNLLTTSANPEFNNPSGIFAPIVDYGVAGGLLYWLLCGLICGYLYKEFKLRSIAGIFLFPPLYIGLIEASRVLYWADGRFVPGMFSLIFGVLLVFQNPRAPSNSSAALVAETVPM